MVWGAIAYDSRPTLIMMRGTLTGQRYVDDILRPHVGSFLNGLPGAIFQFVVDQTIENVPVSDEESRVATALVSEKRVHADANVIPALVILQTTLILDLDLT
ncbi:hypothetical protein TNCV_5130491 [Trichonephila clavipes]|nr:hypothetical protein TNCV_5130491 [Trichonephila clavipes]